MTTNIQPKYTDNKGTMDTTEQARLPQLSAPVPRKQRGNPVVSVVQSRRPVGRAIYDVCLIFFYYTLTQS
jgi:tRNA(Ile2) C34 agmatinyltransferase TiaS